MTRCEESIRASGNIDCNLMYVCTLYCDNYTISYQRTLSINFDLLACGVCVERPFAGGTCTKSFMSRLCSCTGSAFVKKPAKLSAPIRYITRNCPCRTQSRIQWNFISTLFVRFTVSVVIPCAHLLSHSMIVAGCGYPSALSFFVSAMLPLIHLKRVQRIQPLRRTQRRRELFSLWHEWLR